jgi:predicted kinase
MIVVTGVPGSGKTSLARLLARELEVPLVSKDVIKEALFDALGTGDLQWSQRLGRAAHVVMYAITTDLGPAVLESHFWPGVSEADLQALGRPLIQVYCRCPVEVAVARYVRRVDSPDRHPGHLPEHQAEEAIQGWRSVEPVPLALDAPLIEVDTTEPVDVAAVAARISTISSGDE